MSAIRRSFAPRAKSARQFTPPPVDFSHLPLEVQKARPPLKSLVHEVGDYVATSSRTISDRRAVALSWSLMPVISFSTCIRLSLMTAICDWTTCRRVSKMLCCAATTAAAPGL